MRAQERARPAARRTGGALGDCGAITPGPDGKVAAAADPNAPPAPQPPAKKTFLLDWLIN
jgi:hypothetical protein